MSISLAGYIEVQPSFPTRLEWEGLINMGNLVSGSHMFYMLFGRRGGWDVEPIARLRGLPDYISSETRVLYEDYGENAISPSWMSYEEIAAIDWYASTVADDESFSIHDNDYVSLYRPGEEHPYMQLGSRDIELTPDLLTAVHEQSQIECDGIIYKLDYPRYLYPLGEDWKLVFDLMKRLNDFYRLCERAVIEQYEKDREIYANQPDQSWREQQYQMLLSEHTRVRLVVWFDSF